MRVTAVTWWAAVATAPAVAHIHAQTPVACMPPVWWAACWISCAKEVPVVAPSIRRTATAKVSAIGLRCERIISYALHKSLKNIIPILP